MKEWISCLDHLPQKGKLVVVRNGQGELSHGRIIGEASDNIHLIYERHFQIRCREIKYISYDSTWMYLSDYFKVE